MKKQVGIDEESVPIGICSLKKPQILQNSTRKRTASIFEQIHMHSGGDAEHGRKGLPHVESKEIQSAGPSSHPLAFSSQGDS